MKLVINCDGGSRGNPGPAAAAFVVARASLGLAGFASPKPSYAEAKAGDLRDKSGKPALPRASRGRYLGIATNNVAEYSAVIEALGYVLSIKYHVSQIDFFLDSSLVVNQINGVFKIKDAKLRELLMKVRELEAKISTPISYTYVPREQNGEADLLVNETLDKAIF